MTIADFCNRNAGVDYADVVARAQSEADLILWDGGNNDFPFVNPDLHIVLVDSLRPGDESAYHPGEALLRMVDVAIAAKEDVAAASDVHRVMQNVRSLNPRAMLVRGASPVTLDDTNAIRGKRVLVVEDGPTITHGGHALRRDLCRRETRGRRPDHRSAREAPLRDCHFSRR